MGVTVEPRATTAIKLSGRMPHYPAASAFTTEAVLMFQPTGQHPGKSPDLHVQRLCGIHYVPRPPPHRACGSIGASLRRGSLMRNIAWETSLLPSPDRWFTRRVHQRTGDLGRTPPLAPARRRAIRATSEARDSRSEGRQAPEGVEGTCGPWRRGRRRPAAANRRLGAPLASTHRVRSLARLYERLTSRRSSSYSRRESL
jgi:hypothetical protein